MRLLEVIGKFLKNHNQRLQKDFWKNKISGETLGNMLAA